MRDTFPRFVFAAMCALGLPLSAVGQVKSAAECDPPIFPRVVWDIGSGGNVTVRFLVDESGKVIETQVLDSSGISLIDSTSREAIQRCKFQPFIVAGYPTQRWLTIGYYYLPTVSAQALKDLRASAKGGNWHAAAQMARYYLEGRAEELEWSHDDALAMLENAAARNGASAWELGQYEMSLHNAKAARAAYQRGADKGNAAAQHALGQMYADRRSPDFSEKEASRWILQAANNGYRAAQEAMSYRYRFGVGVEANAPEAVRWASAAAMQQGASSATLKGLGDHYLPQAPDKAVEYYRMAASRNSYEAMYALGMLLLAGGNGVPKDEDAALAWLTRSAELGYAAAQNQLGQQLRLRQQDARADAWLYKAARQGEPNAQSSLGYRFTIQDKRDPAQQAEGVTWLRRAAAQEHVPAMFFLGFALMHGNGAGLDMAEARNWYEKAAAKGYPDACFALGNLHEYARGVPKNDGLAFAQYLQAAEKGQADAIRRLGAAYEKGELGQGADAAKAAFWRSKLPAPGKS